MKTLVARLTLVCISFIVMSLMLTGISDAKIDKGAIVGMWLFDEGSGKVAKDSSGNGNDGQFAGVGALKWVNGRSGKGLEFDGKSWLECGKGASLDFKDSENFSIHAVVNASASPTGKCIIWKGLGCSTWSQWLLGTGEHENAVNATNATFHFRTANDGGRTEVRSKEPLPEGKWVQVCGTYDGKKLRIYVDGSLSNEADASGKPWASTEQVYIGADAAHYTNPRLTNRSNDAVTLIFNYCTAIAKHTVLHDKLRFDTLMECQTNSKNQQHKTYPYRFHFFTPKKRVHCKICFDKRPAGFANPAGAAPRPLVVPACAEGRQGLANPRHLSNAPNLTLVN